MKKEILTVVVFFLLMVLVSAIPPPPPSPAGFEGKESAVFESDEIEEEDVGEEELEDETQDYSEEDKLSDKDSSLSGTVLILLGVIFLVVAGIIIYFRFIRKPNQGGGSVETSSLENQ